MKTLVTGSSGHLGEALMRTLGPNHDVVGLDINPSEFTTDVGSVSDPDVVQRCLQGVECVYHTATLHKPHVVTHSKSDFVETNILGTLVLLEAAVAAGVRSFIYTSTTSVFGDAMRPSEGEPATWVTEEVQPIPRNIYGVTKSAAEELCQLFHRKHDLNCIVLRTSRFFPEEDDNKQMREAFSDSNAKANEFLYRRVDLEDVVDAHLLASSRADQIGFGRYIISATTPIQPDDLQELRGNAPSVLSQRVPEYLPVYERLGWKMFQGIDRVYSNQAARRDLVWEPRYSFFTVLEAIIEGRDPASPLAIAVGSKGYHTTVFDDGPCPVD
ncbi:MAG: NAD-dependent epimerase [Planctomycetaceae bacterium]|nr:NAD-dependent epimerase [Planctomycetaceae bacterium]